MSVSGPFNLKITSKPLNSSELEPPAMIERYKIQYVENMKSNWEGQKPKYDWRQFSIYRMT